MRHTEWLVDLLPIELFTIFSPDDFNLLVDLPFALACNGLRTISWSWLLEELVLDSSTSWIKSCNVAATCVKLNSDIKDANFYPNAVHSP